MITEKHRRRMNDKVLQFWRFVFLNLKILKGVDVGKRARPEPSAPGRERAGHRSGPRPGLPALRGRPGRRSSATMARVRSEEAPMARSGAPSRPRRNTAPLWKKVAIVLAAPVAVSVVIKLLHINEWNFFLFFAGIIIIAAAAVWGMARLLGVHLSLGSWD